MEKKNVTIIYGQQGSGKTIRSRQITEGKTSLVIRGFDLYALYSTVKECHEFVIFEEVSVEEVMSEVLYKLINSDTVQTISLEKREVSFIKRPEIIIVVECSNWDSIATAFIDYLSSPYFRVIDMNRGWERHEPSTLNMRIRNEVFRHFTSDTIYIIPPYNNHVRFFKVHPNIRNSGVIVQFLKGNDKDPGGDFIISFQAECKIEGSKLKCIRSDYGLKWETVIDLDMIKPDKNFL